jgi:hypothetical protein
MTLLLTWGLLAMSLIDVEHQLLPDVLVLPLMWLGLIVNSLGLFAPLQDALWGAITLYGAVVGVLVVQTDHRQGRHGPWRFQIAGDVWRLGWLANITADHPPPPPGGCRDWRDYPAPAQGKNLDPIPSGPIWPLLAGLPCSGVFK